jgi:RNA polymerase sigma-70 factor (ECF subfamily)
VGTFRGDAALSSWIHRITFNAAMSRLRTRRPEALPIDNPQAAPGDEGAGVAAVSRDIADWSSMADEHVFRAQLRRRMLKAILALPAVYRAPVVLRDIQGYSTEEASALLRVKDQTLKSRLHRGRVILRKQLMDFAGGLALHHAPA